MKKSMLLVMVALFAVSAHAQEDQGSKSLSFSVDAFSGHLTQSPSYEDGDAGRLFKDNCVEYGMFFNHKFSNGFGYGVDMYAGNTIVFGYVDSEGENTAAPSTASGFDWGYKPRVRMHVNYGIAGFSTYAKLDARLRLDVGASYTASFGSAGGVTVGTALCTFLVPRSYLGVYEGNGEFTEDARHNMIDSFEVYANYSVPFAEKWAFRTQVRAMFTEGDRLGMKVDGEDFHFQNFGQSLRLRWENRITFNALDNVSFYGQVRYQIDNLGYDSDMKDIYEGITGNELKADHKLYLQAGVSYRFDM